MVISDDTRVTAVTKTQDYARNCSLDFSVEDASLLLLRDLMAILVQFVMSM